MPRLLLSCKVIPSLLRSLLRMIISNTGLEKYKYTRADRGLEGGGEGRRKEKAPRSAEVAVL